MNPHPYVVTLGTAGGPRYWGAGTHNHRCGISTAVVVGDAVYLIDCGRASSSQFAAAGLNPNQLRGIFLTHLHSDHTVDLPGFLLFGWMMAGKDRTPVKVIGPGDRGVLPPVNPNASGTITPQFPDAATAGTTKMVENLFRAYSTDITDRMLDSLRPSPDTAFHAENIEIPAEVGFHPNDNPTPEDMEPFIIYHDELVTVSATLVAHPPIAPAFAFRFDTASGSVTISGDTAPCNNLVRLAKDTDLLLHEAIDMEWAAAAYSDVSAATKEATLEHHRKSHTTPEQAGQLATAAGARALALHHLVPGNTDPAIWAQAGHHYDGPLLVPKDLDHLSFTRTQSPVLHHL